MRESTPSMDKKKYHEIAAQTASALGFAPGYETDQLIYFGEALSGMRRFLDVGANKGLYGYLANLVMQNGQIALVEANPLLAADLRKAVATWPAGNGNRIEVFGVAAGDASSTLPFYLGALDTVGTLTQKNAGNRTEVIEVACEPLDRLFAPAVGTLVKIDVEGFEYRVIRGAGRLFAGGARVFIELHGWGDAERGKYPFQVLGEMKNQGFSVTRIGDSYAYDFVRASGARRLGSYLRYAPVLGAKYLIRRSGLRPLIKSLFSRGAGDA